MGFEKIGVNTGKKIIAWTKTGSNKLLVTKPIETSTNRLHLISPISKDTVKFSSKEETCIEQVYHKVQEWHPIDKNLGFAETFQIPEDYIGKGHIYIERIVAEKNQSKGCGTRTIQKILRESLADPNCQGRIRLQAFPLDISRGNPLGFYYKLGFRAENIDINNKCAQWLANGGKKNNVPFSMGTYMYLPKENIEHCLKYLS